MDQLFYEMGNMNDVDHEELEKVIMADADLKDEEDDGGILKLTKILQDKYPKVYDAFVRFYRRHGLDLREDGKEPETEEERIQLEKNSMEETIWRVRNSYCSGFNPNEIKEECEEISKTANKLSPIKLINGLIKDGKEDTVLRIFNLFMDAKDKVKRNKLYKDIRKDEDLGFRRIKYLIENFYPRDYEMENVNPDIFLFSDKKDLIERMFGGSDNIKIEVLFHKINAFVNAISDDDEERKYILNIFIISFGYLSTAYVKDRKAFSKLMNKDLIESNKDLFGVEDGIITKESITRREGDETQIIFNEEGDLLAQVILGVILLNINGIIKY